MESLILIGGLTDILMSAKNIAMVAIGLGFVIFVHELGHFLVAKACGVQVDKFYVGFDVPIPLGIFTIPGKLFHFHYGETEYGIGAIPLGGYVKMLGQDDNPNNAESESDRTKLRDEAGNVKLNPRSYPAKSVPARMAIISAGVIMNIIFGVIFAAIAYRAGVDIQPAVIGATSPGDPAWKANLQIGDRVLRVGKGTDKNEHMRYDKDMMLNLALYGKFDAPLDVLVRHPDGKEELVTMIPSDRQRNSKQLARPTLGIASSESTRFGQLAKQHLPLLGAELVEKVDGNLKSKIGNKDELLAINDEPVKTGADIPRLLGKFARQPITLTLRRAPAKSVEQAGAESSTGEQYTIEVQPRPLRDYGVEMAASAITAVQKDSPAEKAGIKAGDRLVSFAGEPIGDFVGFPQRTLDQIGETVAVEVERGEPAERLTMQVDLRAPPQTTWSRSMTNLVAVETMGIAYELTPTVARVREGGAADGKLQVGDVVKKVQFVATSKEDEAAEGAFFPKAYMAKEPVELDGKMVGWPQVLIDAAALRMPNTELKIFAKRGDKDIDVQLKSVESTEAFLDDRNLGIGIASLTETHQAEGWGEAFSLGAREVKERMTEVFTVVTKLITGGIGLGNLGGPLTIIGAATVEADRGITDLLMFFTFLSANLAVLNFLPIPALDGGHFVFLAWEGIFRKPVNENLQMKLSAAGILGLLALMLGVTLMDIYRFFG